MWILKKIFTVEMNCNGCHLATAVHECTPAFEWIGWDKNDYYFPWFLQMPWAEFQFSRCALQLPSRLWYNICRTISHKELQAFPEMRSIMRKISTRKYSAHNNCTYFMWMLRRLLIAAGCDNGGDQSLCHCWG